ncbi:MAG: DUF1565 domain-containing protein, partial [Candidatus Hydrogenedens sp.]|nr:DUF1565 domain-containing protein [Candidatus Hydrogenedens sp.]
MYSNTACKNRLSFFSVILLAFFAVAISLASSAFGQTFYVNAASTAITPDGRSWATAYPDLQSAVDAAYVAGGGTVWVAQGRYTSDTDPVLTMKEGVALYGGFAGTENAFEDRDWKANLTTIDGENKRRCVIGANDATLDGFTLGYGQAHFGAGIYNSHTSPIVRNCTFTENKTPSNGGAIYNYSADVEVTNCTFTENYATSNGGAIYNHSADVKVTNCTLTENYASSGGVIYNASSSSSVVKNCILWRNGSTEISNDTNSTATITFTCIDGGYEGEGNLDQNPLFVNAPYVLHLLTASPCIDKGTTEGAPATDILGRPRSQGAGIDMGAYEGAVAEEDLVTLTLQCEPEISGRTKPPVGSMPFLREDTIPLQAYGIGTAFSHWTGDLSGDKNPVSLFMDSDKTITAHFDTAVYYVNAASTAVSPDGRSWATAYADLQSAVDAAHDGGGGEIWVAQGNYTSNSDPVLTMKKGVALYGGFAGTESSLEERDWEAQITVIDGEDTRRCVIGAEFVTLDGFILRNGQAVKGGAIYNEAASPAITNCNFTQNNASNDGGAICNLAASPAITNCTFMENNAFRYGGAIYNTSSSPEMTNCNFTENNTSSYGGAIYNSSSSPEMTNCNFTENNASSYGGAIYNTSSSPEMTNCNFTKNNASNDGGALYNYNESSPAITNCNFTKNNASNGGALYNYNESSPAITNCNFTENNASSYGGAIWNYNSSSPEITNCSFAANNASNGGALYNYNESSPAITNCIFTENSAIDGGGMYNRKNSSPVITDCIFTENNASWSGAIYNYDSSSPEITNCTFTENYATYFGIICNSTSSSPVITNCTFTENNAIDGGTLYNSNSSPVITNCILWGNGSDEIQNDQNSSAKITFSCIEGGYEGEGNIDTDPLFVDAPHALQLRAASPCIDTGTTDGAPATDILGRSRPQGEGIDMGAYEGAVAEEDLVSLILQCEPEISGRTKPSAGSRRFFLGDTIQLQAYGIGSVFSHWTGDLNGNENPVSLLMDSDKTITAHFDTAVYHVNAASTALSPDGSSWDTAYKDLQSAVDAAHDAGGGKIWVAQGSYTGNSDPVLTMKEGVALYGGFAGTESALNQRDWNAHLTVIDGEDIRGCVYGANDATLDGFTLSNGRADYGAGMDNYNTSPSVTNCNFTGNNALRDGGALYNYKASPTITNCNFTGNNA